MDRQSRNIPIPQPTNPTLLKRKPLPVTTGNISPDLESDSLISENQYPATTGAPKSPIATLEPLKNEKPCQISGWSEEPKKAKPSGWKWALIFLSDIAMVLVTFPFIAFLVVIARYNSRPVDTETWNWLQNFMKITGTLVPIFFAAIVGKAATKAAAWNLEIGSRLGLLEQLMGSQTIFGTLKTQWELRSFNFLGFGLLVLWALSPATGQAALRLLHTGTSVQTTINPIQYFDSGMQSTFAETTINSPTSSTYITQWLLQLNALYISTILAPANTKDGNLDNWGNVKIPFLSSYARNANGWVTTPASDFAYSSLIGIPILDTSSKNFTFSLESSYVDLDCLDVSTGPILDLNYTLLDSSGSGIPTQLALENGTFQGYPSVLSSSSNSEQASWSIGLDTFVDKMYNGSGLAQLVPYAFPDVFKNESNIETNQATMLLQASVVSNNFHYNPTNSTKLRCKVSQAYVESNITCMTPEAGLRNCSVVAQRPSLNVHANANITVLSWPEVFKWVSKEMPRAFGNSGLSGRSDASILYLQNTSTAYITNSNSTAPIENANSDVLGVRLAQIVNTYLTLGQADTSITDPTAASYGLLNADATVLNSREIFIVSWPWYSIFVAGTLGMICASLFSTYLGFRSLNPQVLGYVSSLVRDSRYVNLPPGRGTLDGVELSLLLKDLRFRMGGLEQDGHDRLVIAEQSEVTRTSPRAKYL